MTRAAWLVPVIALSIVVGKVRSARAPAIGHPASRIEKLDLAANVAAAEPGWRDKAEEDFPADLWSQRDDFHGSEWRLLVQMAHAHHVRLEDVLRAIDEDLHENGGEGRNADVVPCKPRPFYD